MSSLILSGPLLAGALVGLSVAMPFGPVSLVCVQRCLAGGYRCGVACGLGAATAQSLFAGLAVLGADAAAQTLRPWHGPMRMVAAVVLCALGVRILLRSRRRIEPRLAPVGALYASTLLLALSNPMTLLPYLAMASAETAEVPPPLADVPWLIGGVSIGATGWYCGLSGAACLAGHLLAGGVMRVLNVLAGGFMIGLGVSICLR
jgi:threonine/homoserine/homoserine lactone efflux protein